tara:strand:+ start:253 stop:876 length:624 start_codon:yes stop_codon:yes gene_type:complete
MKVETIPFLDDIINKHHSSDTGLCRHYLELYSMALGMEAKNIFEFGCGFSTLSLVKALKITGGRITSVDLRPLSERSDIPSHFIQSSKDIWTFNQGNSLEVVPTLSHEECYDIVLHDGSHTASDVTIDLNNIAPFVKNGGLVLTHDTFHYDLGGEMTKGVMESELITSNDYETEICSLPYGYGLTIIRVIANKHNEKSVNITWRKGV